MKVTTLIEDTALNSSVCSEHGLAQFIETEKHRVLFDTGFSGRFADNAAVLGVDLETADTLVLSHGHSDHYGGMMRFAGINSKAVIYIQKNAERPRWSLDGVVSMDKHILELKQLRIVDGDMAIDDELYVFSSVRGNRLTFGVNPYFKVIDADGVTRQDDFSHEQNLVVNSGNKKYLFAGCAHKGIVNIMDRFHEIFGRDPDCVFGGFHLYKRGVPYEQNEIEIVKKIAADLAERKSVYYTGHCTGEEAFDIMKEILGERLGRISAGGIIDL